MQGTFKDILNRTVQVVINDSSNYVIGDAVVKFAATPVTISYDIEDEFETIIRKSATISLVSKEYLGEYLYTTNARDISVQIKRNGTVLFNGFVSPSSYNQPFALNYDEFSVECIDYLSTLQYYNYNKANANTYSSLKNVAQLKTFKDIITEMLPTNSTILYDNSKGALNAYSVHQLNFYDDDEESIWTEEETLSEVLKYLNLHIIQEGNLFYIFDWNSIKNRKSDWVNLKTNAAYSMSKPLTTINKNVFASSDTNISVDDVYNQVQVNTKFNAQESLFESPLEKDSLVSVYKGKQKFMTEYIAEGNGYTALAAIINMINNRSTDYEDAKTVDWFVQVMSNPKWKFYTSNGIIDEQFEKEGNEYVNQYKIPKYLKDNQVTTAILRMGNVETKGGNITDNSPISKINTNDYLFISVNGNENDTEANHSPSNATLQARSPIIEYIGDNNGGVFSPSDDSITNYLVFSGELVLMPIQKQSQLWENRESLKKNDTVPSDKNGDGRYYIRKWYNTKYVMDEPSTVLSGTSLHPYTTDKGNHLYEYNYSANGNGNDLFSKLPILECELTIGNKRLIEKNIDEYGNSTFQWVTIGNEPTASYVDDDGKKKSYQIKTFSLGVNPKIGDKILGTSFKIQNTIKYQMNLDAEGTAIPIKKDDMLSGQVHFKIVGLINTLWNDITRRHPTFFKHTKWTSESKFILAHCENIIIKDFNCKIYSNNGLNQNDGDTEFTYMSDENFDFTNKREEDFKLVTQLSSEEAVEKGVTTSAAINAVVDSATNIPILGYTYNNEFAKAEEHYINYYWNEYHIPKIILEADLKVYNNFNMLYSWATLDKTFFVMGKEIDLRMNNAKLKLKEI